MYGLDHADHTRHSQGRRTVIPPVSGRDICLHSGTDGKLRVFPKVRAANRAIVAKHCLVPYAQTRFPPETPLKQEVRVVAVKPNERLYAMWDK